MNKKIMIYFIEIFCNKYCLEIIRSEADNSTAKKIIHPLILTHFDIIMVKTQKYTFFAENNCFNKILIMIWNSAMKEGLKYSLHAF